MYVKLNGKTYKVSHDKDGDFISKSKCKRQRISVPKDAEKVTAPVRTRSSSWNPLQTITQIFTPSPASPPLTPLTPSRDLIKVKQAAEKAVSQKEEAQSALTKTQAENDKLQQRLDEALSLKGAADQRVQRALTKTQAENDKLQIKLDEAISLRSAADQRVQRTLNNLTRLEDELKILRMEQAGLSAQRSELQTKLQSRQRQQQLEREAQLQERQAQQLKQRQQLSQLQQLQQKQEKTKKQKDEQGNLENLQLLEQFKTEAARVITMLKEENDALRESVQDINRLYEQTNSELVKIKAVKELKAKTQAQDASNKRQSAQARQAQEASFKKEEQLTRDITRLTKEKEKLLFDLKRVNEDYEELEKEYQKVYKDLLKAR